MTSGRYEVPLTQAEVDTILAECGTAALLVGGQALAIWAEFFEIEPTGVLSQKVTADADFVGSKAVANRLSLALRWQLYLPTFDDSTPQTAKVSTTLPDGGVKQVDFLRSIVGLDTAKIQARAAELELPNGTTVRVLSPPDVLESRLRNLDALPEKQNEIGVAQAELAIAVIAKFFDYLIKEHTGVRGLLDVVRRLTQISFDRRLAHVCFNYGLDPLGAVPADKIDSENFRIKRWPQIQAEREEIRQQQARLQARLRARNRAKKTPR